MFVRTAIIAAAAATANGFLLPSTTALDAAPKTGLEHVVESRLVKINCPGCKFLESGNSWSTTPNYLVLNFTVDGHRLLANGRQLYPVTIPPPLLKAHQVPSSVNLVDYAMLETMDMVAHRDSAFRELRLGTATLLKKMERQTDHLTLVDVEMQINEVEGYPVQGLSLVKAELVDVQGKAYIRDVKLAKEAEKAAECKTWPMLCQYREMFASKPRHRCNHKHHGAHREGQHAGAGRQYYHHHASMFHKVMHRVVMFVKNVALPMIAGALAGVTVGLAAVVILQALALVWQRLFGAGYVRLEQEELPEELPKDVKLDEKAGLA